MSTKKVYQWFEANVVFQEYMLECCLINMFDEPTLSLQQFRELTHQLREAWPAVNHYNAHLIDKGKLYSGYETHYLMYSDGIKTKAELKVKEMEAARTAKQAEHQYAREDHWGD